MNDSTPEITILITAHNEAERVPAALEAILAQDYPMERVEIILVDDRSTDGTAEAARALNVSALHIVEMNAPPQGLSARQTAIHAGMQVARGEIVLLTDAGSRVPREWIRELTGHLGYRDGAVTGPVVFAGPQTWIDNFMTSEALVLFTGYRWLHSHRRPAGLFGSNVALRREAYEQIGGHPAVGFALLEDAALGVALTRAGWSVRYLQEPFVLKTGVRGVKELFARARRLATGPSPQLHQLTWLVLLSNWALIGLAVFTCTRFWDLALLARYCLGLLFIGFSISRYPKYQSRVWLVLFEPVMTLLSTLAYVANLVNRKWIWGGVEYHRRGPSST